MKPWREAGPFLTGSPVDLYFRSRALVITEIEAQSLRYACSLFHWPSRLRWACAVAQIALADGEALGSHMTFVKPDGTGKAPVERPRLFSSGAAPCGGGVWFGKAAAHSEFVVAEGVESCLSGMRLSGVEAGCAALSELGVRRLVLPAEARRVRVYADNDEAGQGVKAAREAARRWEAEGRDAIVSVSPIAGHDANDIWRGRQR
jgi:putative DNA primase/helicase